MSSQTARATPTPSQSQDRSHSRLLVFTALAALAIAITAVFFPSILRVGTARLGSIAPLSLRATHQMATQTMSSTKLTPKEMKEWNQ